MCVVETVNYSVKIFGLCCLSQSYPKEEKNNTHTNLFIKVIGTITFGFQMH